MQLPASVDAPPETHDLSLGGHTDRATSPHPLVLAGDAGVPAALERRPR